MKNTIKNLDLVLGIKPLPPLQPLQPKVVKVVPPPPPVKVDYFKFAEIVNGRCATLGLVINYMDSGHDMYTQITTDPVQNFMALLGITMVMSSITLYTFDKRDESALPENLEQVTGNFNMLSWFINLVINLK
jgi:hypothetical protein